MYKEFRERQSNELNNFPMFFAFSNDDFDKGCRSLGVNPADAKTEIYSLGAGSFIRKSDNANFKAMFDRFETERAESMQDYNFAFTAIRYQLDNHEYCITFNKWDALNALGLSQDDLDNSETIQKALHDALEQIAEGIRSGAYSC